MGTTRIIDHAELLSSADASAITTEALGWPFDAHILVSSSVPRRDLDAAVSAAVDSPRVVAIGLDPIHHHVVVHFGTGTGIPSSTWDGIAAAGNASFKGQEWAAGIEAIGSRAASSAVAVAAPETGAQSRHQILIPVEQTAPPVKAESHWGLWVFFFAVMGAVAYALYRVYKNERERQALRRDLDVAIQPDELGDWDRRMARSSPASSPAVSPASVYTPRIAPPAVQTYAHPMQTFSAPAPVIINNGNNGGGGDLLTGVLLGEALSSPRREVVRETIVREETYRGGRSDGGGSSSSYDPTPDAGGSGSSWSDDDSSSSDGGGSDSSWSGGGGDSGGSDSSWGGGDSGGGSDSGGGGSDF